MRRNLSILILLIILFITACNSSTKEVSVLTPTTDMEKSKITNLSDIQEVTQNNTLTSTCQPTLTQTAYLPTSTSLPTATITPYPIPSGLLTHKELEQRINDWINGKIEFSNSDRLLDEKNGEELRLGVLEIGPLGRVYVVFYNLGFGLIKDGESNYYLINVVGFEDRNGTRFTSVFHNGRLQDQEAIIRLIRLKGERINRGEKISFDQLLPEEFAKVSPDLPLSVFAGDLLTVGTTGRDAWNEYLLTAKNVSVELADFLLCDECSISDVPDSLKSIINSVPEEYNENIPYFFDYHVFYW